MSLIVKGLIGCEIKIYGEKCHRREVHKSTFFKKIC
jgi:hypothetical protein